MSDRSDFEAGVDRGAKSAIRPAPCPSCPYRRDCPSGVWAPEEYDRLPLFDKPTGEQPMGAFFCHLDTGQLCAGWVGCHNMDDSFGLRMALSTGRITRDDFKAAIFYDSPVPLWGSGAEAAAHGKAEIEAPSTKARRTIDKLERRRARKGSDNEVNKNRGATRATDQAGQPRQRRREATPRRDSDPQG